LSPDISLRVVTIATAVWVSSGRRGDRVMRATSSRIAASPWAASHGIERRTGGLAAMAAIASK
jgi:hypothetical protein